jgi:hypothetical protein
LRETILEFLDYFTSFHERILSRPCVYDKKVKKVKKFWKLLEQYPDSLDRLCLGLSGSVPTDKFYERSRIAAPIEMKLPASVPMKNPITVTLKASWEANCPTKCCMQYWISSAEFKHVKNPSNDRTNNPSEDSKIEGRIDFPCNVVWMMETAPSMASVSFRGARLKIQDVRGLSNSGIVRANAEIGMSALMQISACPR